MKRILKIILINIILFLVVWVACDFIIYLSFASKRQVKNDFTFKPPAFTYRLKPYFAIDMNTCFNKEGKIILGGRKADGWEYRNNTSTITIFGCSFAVGQFLETNETFSYKLAQALKCPVHNRALPGKGLQQMYLQSTLESFYKTVPPSHTVIYVMIDDHYRRMKSDHIDILDDYILVNYKKVGNKLEKFSYNNPLKILFNSSYLVKLIKQKYLKSYIEDEENEEKLTDEVLCYFVETKKNLQNGWNRDFNFVVLLYGKVKYEKILKRKLIKNGFTVLSTRKDLNIKEKELEKYTLADGHPNAKAWEIITPRVIKKLELR